MAYSQKTFLKARQLMAERLENSENIMRLRKEKCFAQIPELEKIGDRLGQLGLQVSKVFLDGGDVQGAIERMGNESTLLQDKRRRLLVAAGFSSDYLDPVYSCPRCKDTGECDNHLCVCFTDLLKKIEKDTISAFAPIERCTFENFDVNYCSDVEENGVSPRKLASAILNGCIRYAMTFSQKPSNLLLTGGTGLGKTHLSLAIAGVVIDKGFHVVYGGAQNIFNDLEKAHFNRNIDTIKYSEDELLNAELLIIDDLGSEFSTAFTTSQFYNIVNSRLLAEKSTIINTNNTLQELENQYEQRITSRLSSEYAILQFKGTDIRHMDKR